MYVFGKAFCGVESIRSDDDESSIDVDELGDGDSKTSAEDSIHICINSRGCRKSGQGKRVSKASAEELQKARAGEKGVQNER